MIECVFVCASLCFNHSSMGGRVYFLFAARVMTNKVTGRSRGYGFVNFISEDSAKSAISAMDGQVRIQKES